MSGFLKKIIKKYFGPSHLKVIIFPNGYYVIQDQACSFIYLCKNGEIVYHSIVLISLGKIFSWKNPKFIKS